MQIPLDISFENIAESEALSVHIRQKVDKLEQFFPRLIGCRVKVELPHKHSQQGERFEVQVAMKVPGAELVVNRKADEDVYVSLRDAFDAALRQPEEHIRQRNGQTKTHAESIHGEVVRILDGYGFIEDTEGNQYYFSEENVVGHQFNKLEEGIEVQFLPEMASQGLQAKRVNVKLH